MNLNPSSEPGQGSAKAAFKYNDLIDAFRKLDTARLAKVMEKDDLRNPEIAKDFVQIFRESGCLLLKYPAPAKEKRRDSLAELCAALMAKCPETAILDDLKSHISDAQVFEKGFREILESLNKSEIWKRSPAEQAWGIICRSLGEFKHLKATISSELEMLAAKEGAVLDVSQFRLPTKDTLGTDPEAVVNGITQGLGISHPVQTLVANARFLMKMG